MGGWQNPKIECHLFRNGPLFHLNRLDRQMDGRMNRPKTICSWSIGTGHKNKKKKKTWLMSDLTAMVTQYLRNKLKVIKSMHMSSHIKNSNTNLKLSFTNPVYIVLYWSKMLFILKLSSRSNIKSKYHDIFTWNIYVSWVLWCEQESW